MLNKKLTDSEIGKALSNMTYGGHYCAKCKYDNGKGEDRCGLKGCKIARYASDLITRQKAEIERLRRVLPERSGVFTVVENAVVYTKTVEAYDELLKIISANACKKFARKLKYGVPQETGVIRCAEIDNLLKEMVGETNVK